MKITKKAIKEAPEFILGIDYKATYKAMTIELVPLSTSNLAEAMEEANQYWDDETVWCLQIYAKTEEIDDDLECLKYKNCMGAWNEELWRVSKSKDYACMYSPRYKVATW